MDVTEEIGYECVFGFMWLSSWATGGILWTWEDGSLCSITGWIGRPTDSFART